MLQLGEPMTLSKIEPGVSKSQPLHLVVWPVGFSSRKSSVLTNDFVFLSYPFHKNISLYSPPALEEYHFLGYDAV
jgi:hypothetical protein